MFLVAGCDLPPSAATTAPRVVGFTPALDQGALDRDVTLRIELDRRIAPSSLVDGVVEITSGDNYFWLVQSIDVVHPAIVVRPRDLLDPDVTYGIRVHELDDLEVHVSTTTPRTTFHTSSAVSGVRPPVPTFAEVQGVLAACTDCHFGSVAPLGLDLTSGAAIRATAIGVPATEERPAVDGYLDTEVSAALTGLPRIAPGEPARSYLLYVVLDDPHIAGASMPPTGPPLSIEQVELLQRWIAGGAPTD
jgi:hypothetical protein